MNTVTLTLNEHQHYQTIDGFGANINPVGHWRQGELRPILDQLVDDLGASIFRLDPYGFTNWVDPEGLADRSVLRQETYARVYRSQPFQDAWEMARYLTSRGAQLILNVSGVVPRWMYAPDGKTLADLEAYANMLTSLAVWAQREEAINFSLFGPFNETDIGLPEGPFINPETVTSTLELLAELFRSADLEHIGFVVADQAKYNLDYLPHIATSAALRSRVSVAGMHCYSDIPLNPVRDFIASNGLNHWRYWLTEYGDLDQTGEREWEVAVASTRRLLRGLLDGVQAAMVWDAYDNWHGHDASWSIYGLLRVGSKMRYTPKKRYYAAKQVYRFVPPGSIRIGVSSNAVTECAPLSAAFRTAVGEITLVGLNEDAAPIQLDIAFASDELNSERGKALHLYLTDRSQECMLTTVFPLGKHIKLTIPGESIYTLTSLEIS